MSFKSKDLAYEKKQPAFLQRIRNAQVDSGVDADRHERQIARPRGASKAGNDDDDAPTYVIDDSNNTLSKEEYEAMLAKEKAEEEDKSKEAANEDQVKAVPTANDTEEVQAEARSKQEVTEVGQVQKKRKAARVIGGDDEEEQTGVSRSAAKASKPAKKARKKVKAVQLSFKEE